MMILKLIRRLPDPANILHDRLKKSGLEIPLGTLYAAIHGLVRNGCVEHHPDEMDEGNVRRCCFLSQKGFQRLAYLEKTWTDLGKIASDIERR
ncbi:helix-turn-helix transcriptional regulator [Patescibacteria group bacterium]|nr:helix-turn-helix transcriptional regulator [Patescibacteria group bacterium]MDE1940652.1 helix-turn-helix transcriptional regulator [Patescibacteria group bacterium]